MSTFEQLTDTETNEQVAEVERWLDSLGVTIWADWNVQDPDRRKGAATWFIKQVHDFLDWCETEGIV